jgi:integrase
VLRSGPSSFPAYHQRVQPYIFSQAEVAKLLRAASGLPRYPASPLRPEVIRLAITLLFTTGIRRGELLSLTLGDYDRRELTLHIRETKFYKSRLLPINGSIAEEMEKCLRARTQRKLPVSADTALIWNAAWGGGAYSGIGLRHALQPLLQECGITTPKGKMPRIHDFRHYAEFRTMPSKLFRAPAFSLVTEDKTRHSLQRLQAWMLVEWILHSNTSLMTAPTQERLRP